MADPKDKRLDAGTYLQQFPNQAAFDVPDDEDEAPWYETGVVYPEPGEPAVISSDVKET